MESSSNSKVPVPKRPRGRPRSRSTSRSRRAASSTKQEIKASPKQNTKPKQRTASLGKSSEGTPIRASRRIQEMVLKQLDNEIGDRKTFRDSGTDQKLHPKSDVTMAQHETVLAFGGDAGGALLTLLLPAIVYMLVLTCDKPNSCTVTKMPVCPGLWKSYFNLEVFGIVLAWYVFHGLLALVPFGKVAKGQPLANGRRLDYRCNGFLSLIVTVILFAVAYQCGLPMDYINKHFLQFVTASLAYAAVISIALYVRALYIPANEYAPEHSGTMLNDFFMGRELNPRIGSLDLKFLFELRPGLIGWMLIDWCLCATQYKEVGGLSYALALVTLFHTIYVFDALANESAILTTMDITTEGFGFMLVFGDLVWVPALYCIPARFIYTYPQNAVSNPYALAAICALELLGLIIFRGANGQKNLYRSNPNNPSVAHLVTIPTSRGKGLLCSGYWGLCRRPNYLGDLLMALAWSLPSGTAYLIPYFYPIYFFILLCHRQHRDEAYCRQKYGAAWDRYCAVVPYRIIPYVF